MVRLLYVEIYLIAFKQPSTLDCMHLHFVCRWVYLLLSVFFLLRFQIEISKRLRGHRLHQFQSAELEKSFLESPLLKDHCMEQLAHKLLLSESSIRQWFYKRRHQERKRIKAVDKGNRQNYPKFTH